MNSERLAIHASRDAATSGMTSERPAMGADEACTPLVWVEAEQVFVARGYVYRLKGKRGRMRDSEAMISPREKGYFVVLSSYAPSQFESLAPRAWTEIVPLDDLDEGERLGNVIVAVRHGANEYTVVSTATSVHLARGTR